MSFEEDKAKRDWGYAPEYVEAMWLMLQQEKPEDFVIATGETHTVKELVEETCKNLDIDIEWQGEGVDEIGYSKSLDKVIIKIDPRYYRPAEVDLLLGDPSKAKEILGWEAKTKFHALVKRMVEDEINLK